MSQEKVWCDEQADAWFRRSGDVLLLPASVDDPVLAALAAVEVPAQGSMLDIGGSTGRIAAGFLLRYRGWKANVVEPSGEAITAGLKAFPNVKFSKGSITETRPSSDDLHYQLVVVSGVLCAIERGLLSRAIANTDSVISDGGLLVLYDFDPPYARANPYSHHPGLYTYKQNYASCFLALGVYHLIYCRSYNRGSGADASDPYDRQWIVTVLKKDLQQLYYTKTG